MLGPPLPTLLEPLSSVTVLAPTIGSAGFAVMPGGGASPGAGSYSDALVSLNANSAASASVPAAFSATISPIVRASGFAAPLTVVRLLRTVLPALVVCGDFGDFAMACALAEWRNGC